MPNDQALIPLEPVEVTSGQILKASSTADAPQTANWILGSQQTHTPLLSIGRPDDSPWISLSGIKRSLFASEIKLPTLSDQHSLFRVRLYAEVVDVNPGLGDASVFVETAAEHEVVLDPAALDWVDLGTFLVAGPEQDIMMRAATTEGARIDIYNIEITAEPLASPLPAAPINGAAPLGTAIDADEVHPAARNRQLREAAGVGYNRPRMIWAWVAAAAEWGPGEMTPGHHRMPMMPLLDADELLEVRVNVDNVGEPAKQLVVLCGDPERWTNERHRAVVPADFAGFVSLQVTAEEIYGDAAVNWPQAWIGLTVGAGFAKTEPAPRSLSIWGT